MTNKILNTRVLVEPIRFVAVLEVDIDPDANRLVAYERDDPTVNIINQYVVGGEIVKIVMPSKYATTNKMFIGILDDDGEYDCKFVDGVLAKLVNPRL